MDKKSVLCVSLYFLSALLCTSSTHSYDDGQRVIEMYLVCDKSCYLRLIDQHYDPEKFLYVVSQEADMRLSTLNVSLILVGMEIWNIKDEISVFSRLATVRSRYSKYRAHVQLGNKWSDVSIIVTSRTLSGSSGDPNGLMPLSGCCTSRNGAGILKYTIQNKASLSATLAHELGHSLGLNHDTIDCCSSGTYKCIMSPVFDGSHIYNPVFSNCSLVELQQYLDIPNSGCISNKPRHSYVPADSATCGNGVLDDGEECDCGKGCLYGCCNCCKNCQLIKRAQCYQGGCCNTDTCQYRSHDHVCRPRRHQQCDKHDMCSGTSSECHDKYHNDGKNCLDRLGEDGFCMKGDCLTHNRQCQNEWGEKMQNGADICYSSGIKRPSRFVNCGKESNGYYTACTEGEDNNYRCGMLQCTGEDIADFNRHKNPKKNVFIGEAECISGKYGIWQDSSGYIRVENGTKCGDGLACFVGDCLPVDEVVDAISGSPEDTLVSLCGNGVLDEGETCDCGPYQCECCHKNTCQVMSNGTRCLYDTCHVCDGSTEYCSTESVDDFSKCDDDSGYCASGKCSSLGISCRRVFGDEAIRATDDIYQQNKFENSSQHNGGGYLLYDGTISSWSKSYREFLRSPVDGTCGILLCQTSAAATIKDDKNNILRSKTFLVRYDSSIRVAYYTFEITTKEGITYLRYYPLLSNFGTPCTTDDGRDGYCDANLLTMDNWDWNWYWYSLCRPLPT